MKMTKQLRRGAAGIKTVTGPTDRDIINALKAYETGLLAFLAQELGCSVSTVRRRLEAAVERGEVTRIKTNERSHRLIYTTALDLGGVVANELDRAVIPPLTKPKVSAWECPMHERAQPDCITCLKLIKGTHEAKPVEPRHERMLTPEEAAEWEAQANERLAILRKGGKAARKALQSDFGLGQPREAAER